MVFQWLDIWGGGLLRDCSICMVVAKVATHYPLIWDLFLDSCCKNLRQRFKDACARNPLPTIEYEDGL